MKTLHVELGDRRYPIHIGPGLLDQPDLLRPHIPGRQVLVVSNTTVAPLYLERTRAALDRIAPRSGDPARRRTVQDAGDAERRFHRLAEPPLRPQLHARSPSAAG
ncbi:MAG: hypothetical protein MZV65_14995 [Chromatiales bacterium]|nr:hypothetical protein [Chromatiales bacterium]